MSLEKCSKFHCVFLSEFMMINKTFGILNLWPMFNTFLLSPNIRQEQIIVRTSTKFFKNLVRLKFIIINFNSILYFISHRAIESIQIFKLSLSLINCNYNLFIFSHTIHDIVHYYKHVLWKYGRNCLLAMLHPIECWCSLLYSTIIYILVMSFGITHLTRVWELKK